MALPHLNGTKLMMPEKCTMVYSILVNWTFQPPKKYDQRTLNKKATVILDGIMEQPITYFNPLAC